MGISEIAIRGGMLVDGTGAPQQRLDVGIAGGRIVEIADSIEAPVEMNAVGQIVAPGFIDLHTHYDPQVLWDPALTPSSWQGVTSVVAGSCGYSIAPTRARDRASLMRTLDKVEDIRVATFEAGVDWDFESYGEYLAAVEQRGLGINFGGYVGHTAVRLFVMGDDAYEREASPKEIEAMTQVVRESIQAGALGFSTDRAGFHLGDGGRPVPSVVGSQEEVEALMGVVGRLGRGAIHIAAGEDFEWLYAFQKKLGRPVNWSSILTYPPEWTSRAPYQEKLERHLVGRDSGADVWVQVTCRPIVQRICMSEPTSFYQMPSFAELVARPEDQRSELFADRAWRARVMAEFGSGKWINPGWSTFTVAESVQHEALLGQSVLDLAAARGGTPWDIVCDLALEEDLQTRFEVVFANNDAEGVGRLLDGEGCVLGLSDAGAHVGQICDAVMPTDFLSRWVRDRELMSMEKGIHKVTGEIARVLDLDLGVARVGAPADLIVFDWDRLDPGPNRRVHDLPAGGERLVADAPSGIEAVLVGGVRIREHGEPCLAGVEAAPGRVLRPR